MASAKVLSEEQDAKNAGASAPQQAQTGGSLQDEEMTG